MQEVTIATNTYEQRCHQNQYKSLVFHVHVLALAIALGIVIPLIVIAIIAGLAFYFLKISKSK